MQEIAALDWALDEKVEIAGALHRVEQKSFGALGQFGLRARRFFGKRAAPVPPGGPVGDASPCASAARCAIFQNSGLRSRDRFLGRFDLNRRRCRRGRRKWRIWVASAFGVLAIVAHAEFRVENEAVGAAKVEWIVSGSLLYVVRTVSSGNKPECVT